MPPLILTYHYCRAQNDSDFPGLKGVSPVSFERQIETISRRFSSGLPRIPLESDSESFHHEAWITFDDGFKDTYDQAFPILKRYGLKAVVFICSAPLVEKRVLDVHKIHLLQAKLGFDKFRDAVVETAENMGIAVHSFSNDKADQDGHYRYDRGPVKALKNFLNYEILLADRQACLQKIFQHFFDDEKEIVKRFYMSIDDIKRWLDEGNSIGAHTVNHPPLNRLSRQDQEVEIVSSINFLEHEFGMTNLPFAYPHGISGTWNDDTIDILKTHNTDLAVTCVRDTYELGKYSAYEIPRYDVNDIFYGDGSVNLDGNPFAARFQDIAEIPTVIDGEKA